MTVFFARLFFTFLSIFLILAHFTEGFSQLNAAHLFQGLSLGFLFSFFLVGCETILRKFSLKVFHAILIGLFSGYLFGLILSSMYRSVLAFSLVSYDTQLFQLSSLLIFFFGIYQGLMATLRASEEIYVSLPFVRLKMSSEKKKDLFLDQTVLNDPRIIDLASSGLVDKSLVVPRFIVKELYEKSEKGDEALKAKSRRSLEVLKKLEAIPSLDIRYHEGNVTDLDEPMDKILRLARINDANVITADVNRIQNSVFEGVRVINLHSLSNALKPIMQAGEFIKIKVQRFGKEAKQGVGYLDDGTMVVINGGGDFIGELIKAQVLSVKHTSSGRMIFCNASDLTPIKDAYLENPESYSEKVHQST